MSLKQTRPILKICSEELWVELEVGGYSLNPSYRAISEGTLYVSPNEPGYKSSTLLSLSHFKWYCKEMF